MDGGAWWAAVHAKGRTRLSDFPFPFHFHALEKEMATHSRVLAWRIPGTGEPGGLPSMGLHRVRHDRSKLAAAAEHSPTLQARPSFSPKPPPSQPLPSGSLQKPKWLSGEDLQIAVKRREATSKGEKERYKHMNAELQRIARRDNKAFFRDQCKEIEENNRMGKTRDLFKKIPRNISCKDGLNKGQKCMDLKEAEEIKNR